MVKQKIVIKVSMADARKKSKALSIVVGFCGVISASLDGEDKVVVIGDGVDSITLTEKLRKRMCHAELISVGEEKKEEKKEEVKPTIIEAAKCCAQPVMLPYHYGVMQPYPYVVPDPTYDPNSCSVM